MNSHVSYATLQLASEEDGNTQPAQDALKDVDGGALFVLESKG
jgi:hypothetical protein